MRLRSIAMVVFIASVQDAFADQHWWALARGADFKIYDKCVTADRISAPHVLVSSLVPDRGGLQRGGAIKS